MYKRAKFIRHEHLNKLFWKIFIYNVNNDNNEVCSGNSDEK